jgi:hypothetical protein
LAFGSDGIDPASGRIEAPAADRPLFSREEDDMTFAHRTREPGPVRAGGFPAGLRVRAHSGQFDGRAGIVVDRTPDLRPGSVWVEFTPGQARLVPGYRLDAEDMSDN